MSAPVISPNTSSSPVQFFVLTRHARTVSTLSKFGGKAVSALNEVPANSILVGVLPVEMIKQALDRSILFIYVRVDPRRYEEVVGEPYNPKLAESKLDQLPEAEFERLLRFTIYFSLDIEEVSVEQVKAEASGRKSIYYVGSKAFADGLSKLFGLPVTSTYNADAIPFSPVDNTAYYSLRVLQRNLVINTADEFINALQGGTIKIYRVTSKIFELINVADLLKFIKAWNNDNCLKMIARAGYNINSLPAEAIYYLTMANKVTAQDCIDSLDILSRMYKFQL